MLILRKANLSDILAIKNIYQICSDILCKEGFTYWKNAWPESRIQEGIEKQISYVVILKSNIIGTMILDKLEPAYYDGSEKRFWDKADTTSVRYVKGLAISPDYQKKKLGSQALKKIEKLIKRDNVEYIRLDINPSNKYLPNFYFYNGYDLKGTNNIGIFLEKQL